MQAAIIWIQYYTRVRRRSTERFLVIEDAVIAGSYNFSRSAQFNAENILFIESAPLAETYSSYIDHLKQKYEIAGEALN